jgi:sarcosine oxidase, subunit delta
MKLMTCPLNGPRVIAEFVCGGEVKDMPAQDAPSEDWARYLYVERNEAGRVFEWWMHVPSAYWFVAERDTRNDEIVRTLKVDEFLAGRGAL